VTFVRVTRDQRGYETTVLLHAATPGERPRVLYWYRTAPGVRVGRPALDEEAIRGIEESHPEIEFDWPQLLEEASIVTPEVERRPERRRKPSRTPEAVADTVAPGPGREEAPRPRAAAPALPEPTPIQEVEQVVRSERASARANPLLEQLVGREIASRLRARYAEVASRLAELPDDAGRAEWQARSDALDPDRWLTSEAVLQGIQHADRLFDELRRDLHMPQ
jgi:hypothetical protein